MPTIRIPKLKKNWEVPNGTLLWEALREAEIPIASSCHGELVCGRCKVRVLSGEEHLSEVGTEEKRMGSRLSWEAKEQHSCRAACGAHIVEGVVEIATDYW